jgi:acetylornithine deacetylase/succinyl-diaminopimelate desuccinylase-like protein
MDPVALTRQLIDIESVTGQESAVATFLGGYLEQLGYVVERMPVEARRFNLYARPANVDQPALVFSTHMDTVPPFLPSCEDADNIYGRGACDAKGIIAAQVAACEQLRASGRSVGLLFVVGEERDSQGAAVANRNPRGSRFLVNGEPTDNRIALASKGALRVEVTTRGRMAHSAYPELGESAIEKLLDALQALRAMKLPHNPEIGPSTVNIGNQRHPGLRQGTTALPPSRAIRGTSRIHRFRRGLTGQGGVRTRHPLHAIRHCPRHRHHDRVVHDRHSAACGLGTARAAGSGLHPGGAHGPRVSRQSRVGRGHRVVREDRNVPAELSRPARPYSSRNCPVR